MTGLLGGWKDFFLGGGGMELHVAIKNAVQTTLGWISCSGKL